MDTEQGPAYGIDLPEVPGWLNKGDNAWQMTAATLIGIQSMPGLVILYGSIVKKKWAVNSAFMAFYAFAATYIVWMLVGYRMAFGDQLLPCWGKASLSIDRRYLIGRANMPETGTLGRHKNEPFYPMASLVHFEFMYAAITLILLAGSILGRVNIKAWMAIVPLWLIFSYTVGAFSLWGGGFLFQWGVIDYSGGYVIHVSSGTAGFVAAYWIGPRLKCDRDRFSPNNILLMLAGAGLLWMGWSGFNGGATYAAGIISPIAIINTNISAASSLLVWTCLDVFFSETICDRSCSRHDNRARLHHSRCRISARMGGDNHRHLWRLCSVVHHDDSSQKIDTSPMGDLNEGAIVDLWLEVEAHQYNPQISAIVYECMIKKFFGGVTDESKVEACCAKFVPVLDVYEDRLKTCKYLAGEKFSLADLNHCAYTEYLMRTPKAELITSRPHVLAWWKDISSRPAWVKTASGMQFPRNA